MYSTTADAIVSLLLDLNKLMQNLSFIVKFKNPIVS